MAAGDQAGTVMRGTAVVHAFSSALYSPLRDLPPIQILHRRLLFRRALFMLRKYLVGLVLLFAFCGVLLAETYTGKLDKMDADKKTGVVRDDKNSPHPF